MDESYRWYQQSPSHESGMSSTTRDRLPLSDLNLATDLRRKRFLDLVGVEGLFCFEATKRGAGRALGVDKKERQNCTTRDFASCSYFNQ